MDGVLSVLQREEWARTQFATADLGARRRTRRLVKPATQMAGNSSGSIPQQTGVAADRKAADRLFDAKAVNHAAVCDPHCANTRQLAEQRQPAFLTDALISVLSPVHRAGRRVVVGVRAGSGVEPGVRMGRGGRDGRDFSD